MSFLGPLYLAKGGPLAWLNALHRGSNDATVGDGDYVGGHSSLQEAERSDVRQPAAIRLDSVTSTHPDKGLGLLVFAFCYSKVGHMGGQAESA